MKTILNVGATGTGKTTRVKNILSKVKNRKKYIYDINNEYGNFNEFQNLPTLQEFESKIIDIKNSVIVIEEATIFFSNRGYSNSLVNALVRKRHTKNLFILNFHSINDVPLYVSKLADYVLLSKTFDNDKTVEKKFNREIVVNSFKRVKSNPSRFYSEEIKLI